ncbi:collagen alpha-1(XII) chain-like [Mytilus trossulus]|uniref:collagen alpha-1(XII) chain-like n=1 Tax=Mytilus trossulus TaxID=6551 RepID=UPI003004AB5A
MAEGIMVLIFIHALILLHTTEAATTYRTSTTGDATLINIASSTSTVLPKCHDKIDLAFMIDASGSVGSANFRKMKSFVSNSVSHFTIGPNDAQVGVITFSSQPHFQFALNKHTDKSSLSNAIQNIPYQSGGTNTDIALTYIEKNTFTSASGNRIDARDILVIITDGKSAHPPKTAFEANRLKQRNVEIIVVGIGHADKAELNKMASDPAYVLYATDFDSLSHIYDAIHSIACNLVFTTQTPPTTTASTTTLLTPPFIPAESGGATVPTFAPVIGK